MIEASPKPRRIESGVYLKFIRGQRCVVPKCYRFTQAHHVVFDGQGRIGSKVSDFQAVPCCERHHREYHDLGRERFALRYGLNFEQILIDLLGLFIVQSEACRETV